VAIELDDTAAASPSAKAASSGLDVTEQAVAVAEGTATDPRRGAKPAPASSAPAISDELPPGMRLGHFQLVKKLGAGGMGEVYLATDLALDRPVAIKVLPSAATSGSSARERLIREARAQARVQHPNVGHIYFIGEDQGRLYFAMEYVTGETLGDRLAKGPMPAEDALGVIHDAVLGLREAQRSGFTHRDVKPSNLMVDNHGVVKVLDFGIASTATTTEGGTTGPIAQTSLAGTPLYMAPEQALGDPIDFRADIYALGATLYQLVSGKPPFSANSFEQLVTLHASADRPLIPKGRVPKTQQTALDSLIARMMAAKPEDRFASYDDLLRAIENVSTQYTRPAGVWVRSIAFLIDLLIITIVSSITFNLIAGDDQDAPTGVIAMTLLAGVALLLIVRFGATPGGALFELEVVDVRTGKRPGWRAALLRVLWSFGPVITLSWLEYVTTRYEAPNVVQNIAKVALIAWMLMIVYRLIHASLRVPGKRTPWDIRSNTMVRYRSGKPR